MRAMNASMRLRVLAFAVGIALCGAASATGDRQPARVYVDDLVAGSMHDRFIVKFRDESAEFANADSRRFALDDAALRRGVSAAHVRRLGIGADLVGVSRGLGPKEAAEFMAALARNPNVEYVQADAIVTAVLNPNDTRYPEQWNYFEATGGIAAPAAWDDSTGAGVVVGVIDTGITNHTELNAQVLPGYDFITSASTARDGNGRDANPADEGDWYGILQCAGDLFGSRNSSWHGTHVAGTIAAVTNNAAGVAGVAHGAKIVPARVLGKCGGALSDVVDAMIWASGGTVAGVPANANPAEVINLSLGASGACDAAFQNAINGAVGRGTTVVIAAGNSNANVSGFRPANCANVVAVAATTRTGNRASFSNFGTGIDVSAPGESILSTLNAGTTTPGAQGYAIYSGTSMASPHVAGVAALIQSAATTPLTPASVEALLKSTARALPGTCTGGCGAGIVDAAAAVAATP